MEELGNMSSSEFQVGEPDADPDLRLLETVSLRVEPSKSVSRSMVSLESVPSSLVDWPASRLRLYSFPWRRRSTASHILTHQVLRIRRRFRSALFLDSLLSLLENCLTNVATIGCWRKNYQFQNCTVHRPHLRHKQMS